jgi:hypothetical protein
MDNSTNVYAEVFHALLQVPKLAYMTIERPHKIIFITGEYNFFRRQSVIIKHSEIQETVIITLWLFGACTCIFITYLQLAHTK